MSGKVTAGRDRPVSTTGTVSVGAFTTSGTDTGSGSGRTACVVAGALATGGTRVGGTVPIGVDPALTTGAEGVSDPVEIFGVEAGTDAVRTACCGSLTAGASFVTVTGVDVESFDGAPDR